MHKNGASMLRIGRAARALCRPFRRIRARTGLRGLDFLWLEITRSCNLTCAHCYAESGPRLPVVERMQRGDWHSALDEARSLGCRKVQFIGGEPTMHPDLRALIEHSRRIGYWYCEVYTNATLLDRDLVDFFETAGVTVSFSFYSSRPAAHDRLTRKKGSFDKTVEGIRRVVSQGVPVRAGLISVDGDESGLEQARELLRSLGVRSVRTDRVRGIGRGEQLVPNSTPTSELCGECWRGRLCIDALGDAYPCVFSRFAPVGNFFDDGIEGIVRGTRLHAFRTQTYVC